MNAGGLFGRMLLAVMLFGLSLFGLAGALRGDWLLALFVLVLMLAVTAVAAASR